MRRVLLLTIASCGLIAVGPGTSLARSEHHHRHHGRHHARHHARHHVRRFGDVNGTTPSSGAPSSPTTPSTTPGAGTIASFTNNVLTITLNDGSTVSGTVTTDTEIECMGQRDDGGMNDNFRSDGGPGPSGSGGQGDDNGGQGDDNGGEGDDNGGQGDDDNGENEQTCDTTMLTQGATVDGAVLEITSAGATWKRIELG
jgi:hypothetical protein